MLRRRAVRQGFTLMELLVVLAIISALAAMFYAGAMALHARNQIQAAQAVVNSAEICLRSKAKEGVAIPDTRDASGARTLLVRFGDFDGDGILDGDPERDEGFAAAHPALGTSFRELAADPRVDYGGFLEDTDFSTNHRGHQDGQGRLLDPWKQPLRIAFAARIYGPSGVCIYSAGPDRRLGTEDDIRSTGVQQ